MRLFPFCAQMESSVLPWMSLASMGCVHSGESSMSSISVYLPWRTHVSIISRYLERVSALKEYRTPQVFRAFARVWVSLFGVYYGPYHKFLADDDAALKQGAGGAFVPEYTEAEEACKRQTYKPRETPKEKVL